MTFIEAIKTNKPLTRRNKTWTYIPNSVAFMDFGVVRVVQGTFIDPTFFLEHIILTRRDILANDWIVKR